MPDTQVDEISQLVREMRRGGVEAQARLHGWRVQFRLRGQSSSRSGDIYLTHQSGGPTLRSVWYTFNPCHFGDTES